MRISATWLSVGLLTAPIALSADEASPHKIVRAGPVALAEPRAATVIYEVEPPLKVNDKAPRRVKVGKRKLRPGPGPAPFGFDLRPADAADGKVVVETEYYVCEDRPEAPCFRRVATIEVAIAGPGDPATGAQSPLELRTPLFSASGAGLMPDSFEKN